MPKILSLIQHFFLSILVLLFPKPHVKPIDNLTPKISQIQISSLPSPTPTITPIYLPSPTLIQHPSPKPTIDQEPWGIAKQISEHGWTMKIQQDPRMATNTEILEALNTYRAKFDAQKLTIDPSLTKYAQTRADLFAKNNGLDEHRGFKDFLENQNGFEKLGFTWLGENASYGYQLYGVHLIEWVYAGDKPHDDNQRDNRWNYVGIGVNGTATAIIFGTGKR